MRKIQLVIMLLLSSLSLAQNSLKVQTLNFNAEATNPLLAQERFVVLKDFVRSQDLDILLMQEDWSFPGVPNVSVAIAKDLNYDVEYHFEDGVTGFYDTSTAIMVKKSLHLRNTVAVKLPHSAFSIGDGVHQWVGFGAINILVGGTVDLPNGKVATLWTTHLATYSQKYRLDQINFILDYIKYYSLQHDINPETSVQIFGGDLNSNDNDTEASLIKAQGFVDVWPLAHPNDSGFTMVNDPMDPEYNPMVHSAGEFPAQYTDQGTGRIDYIYFKNLPASGVSAGRVFTAPEGRIWMSDHFSLLAEFNFDGAHGQIPSADSNFSAMPPMSLIDVNEDFVKSAKSQMDVEIPGLRGLSIVNHLKNQKLSFSILSHKKQVYNTHNCNLSDNEISSFSFFSAGDYDYELVVGSPLADADDKLTIRGRLHVK